MTDIQPNEVLVASADGAAATVSVPDPPSVASLAPGASATFTWKVVLTAVGHLDLTVSVVGNDAFSGQKVPSPPTSAAVTSELPAGLVATISASRQTVNTGQPVTMTFTVTNGGEAAARVDEVTQQVAGGSASCGAVTPSLPVTVPSGESRSFAWSCTAAAAASLSLSGTATGVDVNSSLPISASPAVPAAVEVQAPAALAATLALAPPRTTASVGQSLTVRLTVRDTGGASADLTSVALATTSGAAACTALGPATPQVLEGGASLDFDWTCIPATPGSLNLRGTVSGSDVNTGAPLSATAALPAPITVQLPPGLAATVSATPGTVDVGQVVTVAFTVTNGGGAQANGVAVTPSAAGTAAAGCGPATPTTASIAPGGSRLFSWTCTPSAAGALALSGTASGTDANSELPVTATPAVPAAVTVQIPAALTAALAVDGSPTTASVGQSLTVRLTVDDAGGASATVATVTATPPGICAAATPSPPQVVSPGDGVTFTWTCTPASAGSLTLGASVSGSDRNSGAPLSASAALAAPITVQQPPVLTATVAASPGTVDVGQDVTMTFTVVNGGGVGANGVAVAPTAAGTAVSCGPVAPAAATIGPAGSQVYTRTCRPSSAGTLVLSGTASGTDANSGQTVTATPATAASVAVQVPAQLAASLAVVGAPATASVGQVLNVRLTVSDTGGASATVASVAPTPDGICTAATPVPPQLVTPAASVTFTWTCTPATAGALTLGASVTGAGVNSGAPLAASAALAAPITVQVPPELTATVAASPGTVDVGQEVEVTFTVVNGGEVRANGVAVAPSLGGTAAASCVAAAPASAGIDPAGTQQYAWTCTPSSAGTLVLGGTAAGIDANSGLPVTATPAVAASVTVQEPAALAASIAVVGDPATAEVGQVLDVQLTVSDTGEASAAVASVTPTPAGICTSATPAPPLTITPPGSVTFSWTCTPSARAP